MLCSCKFTSKNIIEDSFSCRGSIGQFSNTVVYRAMITLQVPSSITDADDIVATINKWVQTEPSVRVNGVTLDVDSGCPTMLDSFAADDCIVPPVQTDPPPSPSSSSSSSSSSPPYGIIIGAGVAVVVIILLLIIVIVIIVVYRRHKSTYKYVL